MRRIAVTFALFALAAAACATSRSPSEVVSGAPAAARETGTAKMEMRMKMSISGGQGQSFEINQQADGALDFAEETGRMTLTLDAPVFGPGAEMQSCETLFASEETIYVKVDPSRTTEFGGKGWVKASIEVPTIQPGASTDPRDLLEFLSAVGEEIEEVGTEEVRGVETTRYHVELSVEQLVEQVAEDAREAARRGFEQAGIETLPMDVWIDGDDLPRRVGTSFESAQGGASFDMEMTVEFFDYGEPVDVELPASDDVFEAAEAQQAFSACFAIPSGMGSSGS